MKILNIYKLSTIRPTIRAALKYKKTGSVLDLGSGPGRHTLFLAKKGFQVTAVERSRKKTAKLKKFAKENKLNIKVVNKNIAAYQPKKTI